MKDVMRVPSRVERRVRSGDARPLPRAFSNLVAWLFTANAERWRRRAQFYERHRDYFPRLASSPFVDRCRELESVSREFSRRLFALPVQDELVPVRVTVPRVTSSKMP